MTLAWKLLKRDWQSGELRLIAISLVMSVAVVASVTLLADRVEKGLVAQSSSLLAGDLSVQNSREIEGALFSVAEEQEVETSWTASFRSMVFHNDFSHLASVRAVQENYPLRGSVIVSDDPFSSDFSSWETIDYGPPAGEIWVEERLLPLLDIELGDEVEIGRATLTASRVLISEPDSGSFASFLGARVLMNRDDVDRSGVVQPGSRITYQVLLAGEPREIATIRNWAQSNLGDGYRVTGPERAERGLERTMENGRSFLTLAGSIGVMLAGVALAMASRRYTERHTDQVALWKSWGHSRRAIRNLYLQQLVILALLATLCGLAIGWVLQEALLTAIRSFLPEQLPRAPISSFWTASITGPLCLAGFAVPAFWRLLDVSPLQMLRRDLPFDLVSGGLRFAIGLLAITTIIAIYGGELDIAAMFFSGLIAIIAITALSSIGLLKFGRMIGQKTGSVWRLALNSLWRRRGTTLVQLIAFGATLMLLLVMLAVRTSLVDEWQMQLAPQAPNHFLVNVAEWELNSMERSIEASNIDAPTWYPMVRGRLAEINGVVVTEQLRRQADINRELNLTAAAELPVENTVVEGAWWNDLPEDAIAAGVSVESDTAEALGLKVGDVVTFDVGGLPKSGVIRSIRDLNWQSMTPNFYFIFAPEAFEDEAVTFMSSVYVPPDQRRFVSNILGDHPTVLVIAIDQILEQLRRVVSQISSALQLMLLVILACGFLVLFSAVSASLAERMREGAVLRVLGSGRNQVLGALAVEFLSLGLMAGLTAAAGAELVTTQLQLWVFNMTPNWHPTIWIVGPLAGALMIGLLGLWSSRSVVRVSPLQTLARN